MEKHITTLADIQVIERTALTERNLPQSTYEALLRAEAINPNRIALRFFLEGDAYWDQVFYTYKDLIGLVNQTANMFHSLGVRKHDVVSMILPNLPQALFTIWGGQAAGVVNPIDPTMEAQEMADVMNAAGSKLLVTLASFPASEVWQKVALIANEVHSLETILQVDLTNYLSSIQRLALRYVRFRQKDKDTLRAKVLDFGQTAYKYPAESLVSSRQIAPDEVATLFYRGKVDGSLQFVGHTHFNEVYNAWGVAQFANLSPDNILLCGMPLSHVDGLILNGMLPFMHGAEVILGTPHGFDEKVITHFWRIVEHYRVNAFNGWPELYDMLLDVPQEESDLSSLSYSLGKASPLTGEQFQSFEEHTDVPILAGYGLIEGTCISSMNPLSSERRPGSVGWRLPYQEMKVVRLDEQGAYQRDCATDETGSIVVRGPNVAPDYAVGMSSRMMWVMTGDGLGPWLLTGNLGRQDAEGHFWLEG